MGRRIPQPVVTAQWPGDVETRPAIIADYESREFWIPDSPGTVFRHPQKESDRG